jgi:CRP-like cAMP-binding protein
MFHPVNYLIAFAAYLFQFNIFSAVYAGTSVGVIRTTINGPATSALYGLLLPTDRTVLRTFLRGTVVRISILAGSAILWVGAQLMPPRYLSLLAFVFVAAWLGTTFMLKRRYSTILINLLRGELPDFYRIDEGDLKALFKGIDVGPMLLQKFRGSTGQEAVWYAEAMHTQGVEALDAAILDKLAEADDATRLGLLPYLSEKAGRPALDAFLKLVDPEKSELMVALARTAKRVYPDMPETMEKEIFEKARNPEVKACFLGWLHKHDPEQAAELISGWLGSETLAERRAGVLALRESDRAEDMESLRHLLEVEIDPSIIVLGLRVFSAMDAPDLVDQILPFLKHPQETVRLASVEALSPGNEPAIHALIIAMGDPSNAVRNLASQRLEDIPLSLLPVLVAELGSHSRRVRDGLFQLTRILDTKDLDVSRFCQGQLKIAYDALAQAEALEQTPKSEAKELLVKHLDELADVRVENVVNGLAAWDATGQIGTTLRGLRSDDERARGDSLEALDSLLDRSLTRLLIPLLEKQPRNMKLTAGKGSLGQTTLSTAEVDTAIERFLKDPDWVTTILAIDDLVTWGQIDEYRSLIEPLVNVKSKPLSTLKLSQIDLFRSLSVNQLVEVASVTEEVRFAPETEISFDEEANRGLHLIVAGEVSVEQERPDSQAGAAELARFGAGQSIGIAMLFGMSPQNLKIRILQESVMLRIGTQAFLAMAKDAPVISLEVARVLCERLGLAIELLKKESKTPLIESSGAPAGLVGNALPDRVDDAANEQIKIFKRVAQLRQIDLFRDLSAHHLATIAVVAEEVLLTPESTVFSDDVPCRGLYLIVAGEVAIEQDRPDNQAGAVQLTRFGPGQVFALGALFGMKMSGLKARTLCETEALVITKTEFYAIAMEHPDIALRTCQVLSERLGGVIQELERKDG